MRKTVWLLTVAALCGLSFLALAPPDLMAQWGVIQRGVEAARPAPAANRNRRPATKANEGSGVHEPIPKPGCPRAPVTYQEQSPEFLLYHSGRLASGAGRPHR